MVKGGMGAIRGEEKRSNLASRPPHFVSLSLFLLEYLLLLRTRPLGVSPPLIHEFLSPPPTWILNIEFLLVHSIRASSQLPRLYAMQAMLGSRRSAYCPTTSAS